MDESILYRLKNLTDHNVIAIHKTQFKIGRAATNDLAFVNNPYVSSIHCIIEYDNGHTFIRDTSSNGTLINRTKKLNKNENPIELQSGDIIHLVFRKDEPKSNIVFQMDISPSIQNLKSIDSKRKHSNSITIETKENTDSSKLIDKNTNDDAKRIKVNDEIAMKVGEDMESILTCVCCQDIMSNPICLEPCLHALCTDCYASWEAIKRTCPQCRAKVTGKKKNVVINGILEAFLKAYPHKRPALKSIDNGESEINEKKNKRNKFDFNEINENETDEEHDGEISTLTSFLPVINARFFCRQCPQVHTDIDSISMNFQCRPGQSHILCQCCFQPMPDRQNEMNIYQSCEICHQYFCNIYFGQCQRDDCLGCLNQLRNFNFSPRHLINFVNENHVETDIVKNYLAARQMNILDLLIECCRRLDRREFNCSFINRNVAVPSKLIACYKCAVKVFRELSYQYRVSMKQTDIFPIEMRNREDCYYGKQCRTQYTKLGHAQKLNHACNQTRFYN